MLKYLYSVSQYSFNLKHEEKLPAWHVHIAQAHPSLQSSHRTLSDSTHFLFILWHEALSPHRESQNSLAVISIIMLLFNPQEPIWRSIQEKTYIYLPSLIQGTKWFEISRGARGCIIALVTVVTCLQEGRRKERQMVRDWRIVFSWNLWTKVTSHPQSTSEGICGSNLAGPWGGRLRVIPLLRSTGANQGCLLCWAVCF